MMKHIRCLHLSILGFRLFEKVLSNLKKKVQRDGNKRKKEKFYLENDFKRNLVQLTIIDFTKYKTK